MLVNIVMLVMLAIAKTPSKTETNFYKNLVTKSSKLNRILEFP